LTSVQYLVIIVYIKKSKITDRKNPVNIKGEHTAESKTMMEMSFILIRYCQIFEEQITFLKSQGQQHRYVRL